MQRGSDAGSVLGAPDGARSAALPGRFATDVAANHAVPGRAKPNAGRAALRSGDVGNRVVGERPAACTGQASGTQWRTSLHRPRRPPAQVLADASDDCRILDQRDDAHRPLALGAFQGIGRIDFADQPRPRSLGTGSELGLGCSLGAGSAAPACGDASFARSPRARFEYQPT